MKGGHESCIQHEETVAELLRQRERLADALLAFKALHRKCTSVQTRDTRCAVCKQADVDLRAVGRLS